MTDDDVPTSRLGRAACLPRLGARSGAGLARRRDPAELAAAAAETLAELRGLAAKAGQLGSYLDAALGTEVPLGVREALQRPDDATRTWPFEGMPRSSSRTKEAEATRAFAALLADEGDVVLPSVVDAWTGPRVLTTTWCEGVDLDTAATHPDEALRSRWVDALLGSFATSAVRGLVHGDPNAGNFRFRADGVAILDLGCVQPLPAEGRAAFAAALVDHDPRPVARQLVPDQGAALEAAVAVVAGLLAPLVDGGPVDPERLRRVGRDVQAFKATMARHRLRVGAPWAPLVLRTWLGLLAHAAHLRAPVDAARLRARLRQGAT
jgi:hypothetical protein